AGGGSGGCQVLDVGGDPVVRNGHGCLLGLPDALRFVADPRPDGPGPWPSRVRMTTGRVGPVIVARRPRERAARLPRVVPLRRPCCRGSAARRCPPRRPWP